MRNLIAHHPIRASILIFSLCMTVRLLEVVVIRTDETILAECFIHKGLGILLLLYALLSLCHWHWHDIGFGRQRLLRHVLCGFGLCLVCCAIAFAAEFTVLYLQGTPARMEFFAAGFSLTGNLLKQTGAGYVLLCIVFNLLNVWMEEGLFRGFFLTYLGRSYAARTALCLSALGFGLWHLASPCRSLLDGEMGIGEFAVMGVGYVLLSAMMGVKWGWLYQVTGTVWTGLADHFLNNCIVTNLLHVVTEQGVDDLQILRVLIGQCISLMAVAIYVRAIRRQRQG